MKEIPTAIRYLTQQKHFWPPSVQTVQEIMIEFAKLHVEAALKAASGEVPDTELVYYDNYDYSCGVEKRDTTYKEDILNSYPLELIK